MSRFLQSFIFVLHQKNKIFFKNWFCIKVTSFFLFLKVKVVDIFNILFPKIPNSFTFLSVNMLISKIGTLLLPKIWLTKQKKKHTSL